MSPILTDRSFDVISHNPAQTCKVGDLLGEILKPGDVVCLQGDLGTGKTCLTKGIGAGLDVEGIISSPTFVFVNEYPPTREGPHLYHVDLYRIQDYADVISLGLEDYIYSDGVTVIEWAERAMEMMPKECLWITLSYANHTKRMLLFEAKGDYYTELLQILRETIYGPQRK